jgi:5-formyltetrahydrofolate cyclo-ligase
MSSPPPTASQDAAKSDLRDRFRRVREAIGAEEARAAAEAAAVRVIARPELAGARTIALYAPIRSELSTEPLRRELRARGIALAYPKVVGPRQLTFHPVASPRQLGRGHWGIREPAAAAALDPGAIDAFVVPGIAFDLRGGRLGWGRGYYDAALDEHERSIRIGFAYACQLAESLPTGAGDAPMDLIVTETATIVCPAGRLAGEESR